MTSKSLKRRKTITHKKVRNHKKTRARGGNGNGEEAITLPDPLSRGYTPKAQGRVKTGIFIGFFLLCIGFAFKKVI